MTLYEIEQEIEKQEADLELAEGCDEETACKIFNFDSKAEVISEMKQRLETYKSLLQEFQMPSRCELESVGEKYGYDFY